MTSRLAHTAFGSAVAICVLSGATSVVTWRPVTSAAAPAVQDQEPVVLVGAGDIANCQINGGSGAVATAALLDRIPGTVFTVGDHACHERIAFVGRLSLEQVVQGATQAIDVRSMIGRPGVVRRHQTRAGQPVLDLHPRLCRRQDRRGY